MIQVLDRSGAVLVSCTAMVGATGAVVVPSGCQAPGAVIDLVFGASLTAAPLDAHGRLNLALVLANWSLHGHPELRPRVEQSFARAVQASPFRGYYRRDWGQYEAAAGHAQAAQAQYAAAIALDDGDPASYRGLGEALLAAGNPAGARTAFLASLRLDPWQPDLQRRITLLASLSAP